MFLGRASGLQTLSRAPLPAVKESMDDELMESTNIYVDNIVEHLPASQSFLENLRELLKSDSVMLRECVKRGGPNLVVAEGLRNSTGLNVLTCQSTMDFF